MRVRHMYEVLDARGLRWTIERRGTPWRRAVRPVSLVAGRYPRHTLDWPVEEPPDEPRERTRLSRGEKAIVVALAPLAIFDALKAVVGYVIGGLLALPVVVLELALLAVAAAGLAPLRAVGLVRYRVDVTCRTGRYLHAETVLLVRGRRRARQLAHELAAGRQGARKSFWPTRLPDDVTVRAHRSIWQSSAEWVTK
ncbi:MAG: hypothetical protein WBA97_11630 [Actinophytocola sp.]|uniref:hypothetical protein n=1 Tax=Actinophytocola sp. TaxID=1872138 RepID=UPI003C78A55B